MDMNLNTEQRQERAEEEWQPRELEGGGDVGDVHHFDKQSGDVVSSDDNRRGRRSRWVPCREGFLDFVSILRHRPVLDYTLSRPIPNALHCWATNHDES